MTEPLSSPAGQHRLWRPPASPLPQEDGSSQSLASAATSHHLDRLHSPALITSPLLSASSGPRLSDPENPGKASNSVPGTPERSPENPSARLRTEKSQNGFVAYISTQIVYVLYLLWALLPPAWTQRVGLGWLPDREWTTIIPSFLILTVILTYFSYLALMAYNTPSFDSLAWLADGRGQHLPPLASIGYDPFAPSAFRAFASGSVPPRENQYRNDPIDVPLSVMNRRLFPPRPRPTGGGVKR